MKTFPVVLFVYNRLMHTVQTIEALQKNYGASDSILYIYSDGPRNQEDEQGVAAVRRYVKDVTGFADVIIVEREQNLGLAGSLISGITEVLDSNESIIVLEDDLITSPFFLQFMNDALKFYEFEEQVAAIHGYFFPLQTDFPDTFLMRFTGCWGWGTWKRGWSLFEPDGNKLLKQIIDAGLTKKFDMNGAYPYTQMLEKQVKGKVNSWAIRWYASIFLSGKLNLYPGESLVKNIGHDGSGEHSFKSDLYDVCLSNSNVKVSPIMISEDIQLVSRLESYFKNGHSGLINFWIWKLFGRQPFIQHATKVIK